MVERPRFHGTRIDGKIWAGDGDGNRSKEWETRALLDHESVHGRVFVATRRGFNNYVAILREKENGLFEEIAREKREKRRVLLRSSHRDPVEQGKELLEDAVRAETSQAVNNTQTAGEE